MKTAIRMAVFIYVIGFIEFFNFLLFNFFLSNLFYYLRSEIMIVCHFRL